MLAMTPRRLLRSTRGVTLALASAALLGGVLLGCAQTPATSGQAEPEGPAPGSSQGLASGSPVVGPILGTVEVWLGEHGIMAWQPRVEVAGAYRFEVTNHGREPHDLTVLRWQGDPRAIPERSGRALLQSLDVVAQSAVLAPGQAGAVDANLDPAGTYVLLSSQGTDYGAGVVTTLRVGAGEALPVPRGTPDPRDDETVAVYLLDRALLLAGERSDSGDVTLRVQNLGPSPHDLVVLRWRGDHRALPVDAQGEVLLDGLIVVARLATLPAGAEATLDVTLESGFAYAVFSSLPGDYAAGMSGQVTPR